MVRIDSILHDSMLHDSPRCIFPALGSESRSTWSHIFTLLMLLQMFVLCGNVAAAQEDSQPRTRQAQRAVNAIVIEAFAATHDGWSSDEVILQTELNSAFIEACNAAIKNRASELVSANAAEMTTPAELNWTLLNLRKAGKLTVKATKRNSTSVSSVAHIAEIVTRSMLDRHQCSIDRLMCDPVLRNQFDAAAKAIAPDAKPYTIRKAAFQLRKARKLRPELITRIADWGRQISTHSIEQIIDDPNRLNEHPGIYIFRDGSGYLYIGQTENLRKRMLEHLDESHNLSLAKYLKTESREAVTIEIHDFDPESQAAKTMVRRAYESELIASRKPRFNVQP